MKKLFTNLLLMLVLGVGSAWADGNKRVLNSQNYETATATDWTSNTATVSLATGDATYGSYAKNDVNGSGNRAAYKSTTLAYTAGSGYTTADMKTAGYVVEFDMKLQGGRTASRSVSSFVATTAASPNLASNTTYSGTDYIFTVSQPTYTADGVSAGSNGSAPSYTWYINDLANSTGSTVTLNAEWYHYKLVVTASSVTYAITQGTTEIATGSKEVTSMPSLTGFWTLTGRSYGFTYFDNLEIYDYTNAAVADAPTIAFKSVKGNDRVYTISNTEGQDLYYKLPGDEDYTKASSNSVDVTVTTDGTVYAYAKNGDAQSNTVEQAVTCGAITLVAPTYWKKSLSDNTFAIEFYSDQSSLLGKPTAKIMYSIDGATAQEYSSAVNVNAWSTITAYCTNDDYTQSASTSCTPFVLKGFTTTKTLDFSTLTDGKGANGETTATFGSSTYYQYLGDGTSVFDADFYVAASENSNANRFYNHNKGLFCYYSGSRGIGVANLKAGQVVKINSTVTPGTGANVASLSTYDYGTVHYFTVSADGNCSFSIARNGVVYSIEVLSPANNGEVVGAVDYSTNYFTKWNTTPVQIADGETAYYKFINHNMGSAAANYQNWYLFVANTSSENKTVLRADAAVNIGGGTITANNYNAEKVNFKTDLCDATVELFVTYKDGTLTSTAKTTKANGETLPDYIYTQTGYTDTPLNVYVSVEKNWLEVLTQGKAVAKTLGATGFGTFSATVPVTVPEGVTVYTSTYASNTVTATPDASVTVIPANTGVIFKGEASKSYTFTATSEEGSAITTALTAAPNGVTGDGSTIYGLLKDSKTFALVKSDVTLANNSAYLKVSSGAKAINVVFDDETTGISNVNATVADNAVRYNLAGQRVSANTKGIVIMNGKKYLNK